MSPLRPIKNGVTWCVSLINFLFCFDFSSLVNNSKVSDSNGTLFEFGSTKLLAVTSQQLYFQNVKIRYSNVQCQKFKIQITIIIFRTKDSIVKCHCPKISTNNNNYFSERKIHSAKWRRRWASWTTSSPAFLAWRTRVSWLPCSGEDKYFSTIV